MFLLSGKVTLDVNHQNVLIAKVFLRVVLQVKKRASIVKLPIVKRKIDYKENFFF